MLILVVSAVNVIAVLTVVSVVVVRPGGCLLSRGICSHHHYCAFAAAVRELYLVFSFS